MTSTLDQTDTRRLQLSLLDRVSSVPWPLFILVIILSSIGVAMQYSAGGLNWEPFAGVHVIRLAIFFTLAVIAGLVDIRVWFRLSYLVFGVTLVMLIAVPFIGEEFNNAKRWIDLRVMTLQPSELVQVGLIMALSRYLNGASWEELGNPLDLIFPLVLAAVPTYLIMDQPDLGTSLKLVACLGVVMFLAGLRWWLVLGGAGMVIGASYWFVDRCLSAGFEGAGYQCRRVLVLFDDQLDLSGAGYHIRQAKIAIGSGGVEGQGFGQGQHNQLGFTPENNTDFVWSLLAEEFGFIGCMVVLFLYSLLLLYGVVTALRARSQFGRLLAATLTANLFFYIVINIGMNMGLLPVVGMPLPFLSYGGSAMLATMGSVALLTSIWIHADVPVGEEGKTSR
ncbi:MAG: rod shape-determining protein RodA [Alphaproteobacteria bacterium]